MSQEVENSRSSHFVVDYGAFHGSALVTSIFSTEELLNFGERVYSRGGEKPSPRGVGETLLEMWRHPERGHCRGQGQRGRRASWQVRSGEGGCGHEAVSRRGRRPAWTGLGDRGSLGNVGVLIQQAPTGLPEAAGQVGWSLSA